MLVATTAKAPENCQSFFFYTIGLLKFLFEVRVELKLLCLQGLKRSEQHVLAELFKTRVIASSVDAAGLSERGRIQPIKKLEKLMRAAI